MAHPLPKLARLPLTGGDKFVSARDERVFYGTPAAARQVSTNAKYRVSSSSVRV